MSPPCASPLYLSNGEYQYTSHSSISLSPFGYVTVMTCFISDTTPFKESPVPQSLVVDVPRKFTKFGEMASTYLLCFNLTFPGGLNRLAWISSFSFVKSSESVTDYIQEAKAHMNQTCDETEAGLSLTSHYVDVQMIRRETRWPGRTANKCLSKQLVILGDTDRQNRLLGRSQVGVFFFQHR